MADTETRQAQRIASSLSPEGMLEQIRAAAVSHVVTVPDTHQRSLLALLAASGDPRLLTVCTEDEAIALNAGLYLGGTRPLLLIQNTGFFAAMNSLRGVALDGRIPTCMLIGEFSRDPRLPSAQNPGRVVHLLEPTLELWGVPYYRLEQEEDLPLIGVAYERSLAHNGPVALLVGATTADAA